MPPGHWVSISRPMFSLPRYQLVNGGISHVASALSSRTIASMSLRQNASTYWSSSTRCPSSRSVVDGVLGQAAVGHLGVGALERGVDRGDGGVERLGDLGGRPAQHVAQDQHGALPGRQVLEGGDEGEPDRVALGDHDGGVGHRLEPGDLVVSLERVAGHLVGGAEPGGQRPPRAGPRGW